MDPDRAKQHQLYHEAQRRLKQPQPVVRYTADRPLILPSPNNIIFELFGTVVLELSSERLLDYVSSNLANYLKSNWSAKMSQRIIRRLRREQALDARAGLLSSAPLIRFTRAKQKSESSRESSGGQKSPPLTYKSADELSKTAVQQVYEHVMWRIRNNRVTQITSLLIKLMLDDAYKQSKLKAESFADVAPCFEDWRAQKLIKLYAFGNAPANDQKLILANTSAGDLTRWIANYIDGSDKQTRPDLLRKLVDALRDKTRNCFYLTNDLNDAIASIRGDAIRCSLLVDRNNCVQRPDCLDAHVCDLIRVGKLFIVDSLACIQLAPDPTSENCC